MKSLVITSLILGIFIIGMVNVHVYLATENDRNATLLENSAISEAYGNLSLSVNTSESEVNESVSGFLSEKDILSEFGDLTYISFVGSIKKIFSAPVRIFNILTALFETLGVPKALVVTIMSILGIVMLFLGWKALKTGT